jgi:protein transport protein SEC61 subunit alpha
MDYYKHEIVALVSLLTKITPSVAKPSKPCTFNEKLMYTIVSISIYLVLLQLPLYGAYGQSSDPYYHYRLLMGSSRGTVMELGLSPIITSSIFVHLASTTDIYKVNHLILRHYDV